MDIHTDNQLHAGQFGKAAHTGWIHFILQSQSRSLAAFAAHLNATGPRAAYPCGYVCFWHIAAFAAPHHFGR
jgi:hypothetical protein